MRYRESVAKSAEYLRLALPQMTRQKAALHPYSYAVWYEHVSGANPALSKDLNVLLERQPTLDEQQTRQLYQRHVAAAAPLDEAIAHRLSQGIAQVLHDMAASATEAGDASTRFGDSLSVWMRQVGDAAASLPGLPLRELLAGTQEMHSQMGRLRERLASSQREIEDLRQEVQAARGEALIDALTGLANRRAFDQGLAQCLHSDEAGTPTGPCLILSDIDHFKRINDSHGHAFGDEVLRHVGQALRDMVQSHHLAARYGGEEFAVLMPSAGLHEAVMLAEQMRERIAEHQTALPGQRTAALTISLGVTQLGRRDKATDFLGRADQALYAAKHQGRNRVVVLPAPLPPGEPDRLAA